MVRVNGRQGRRSYARRRGFSVSPLRDSRAFLIPRRSAQGIPHQTCHVPSKAPVKRIEGS